MPDSPTVVLGRATGSRAVDDGALAPGDELGGYQVVRRLATGGMAHVYEARDRERAPAALKVAHARRDDAGATHVRFLREAHFLSRLDHPGVVRVRDVGHAADGRPWMAMELLTGATIAERLAGEEITAARAVAWLRAIAATLAAAHHVGVIHRDLKPDNVFVTDAEEVKVLDWGVAFVRPAAGETRFTRAGLMLGTPRYMSPEQARGLEVDGRADVYSLGVVAYELLTGRVPFDGASEVEVAAQHLLDDPPPLDGAPAPLADLVMRMLAKDPARRPTIDDVGRELAAR